MCQGVGYAVSAGTTGRRLLQNALALNLQFVLLWGQQECLIGARERSGRAGPAILAGWQSWDNGVLQVAARAAQLCARGDLSYQCARAIVRGLVTLPIINSCLMLVICPAAENLHEMPTEVCIEPQQSMPCIGKSTPFLIELCVKCTLL